MATSAHTAQASTDHAGKGDAQGEEWAGHVVRAHFNWERANDSDPEAARRYHSCLDNELSKRTQMRRESVRRETARQRRP